MDEFKFYLPLQVRYGDIDAQGHVNNAHTLTFIEQGRFAYLRALGLWDGTDFFALPMIVADVHISYLAPVYFTQNVRIGVRVGRIGNKSVTFEYAIQDCDTGQVTTRAETVMVYYDYHTHTSLPVTAEWRQKISDYEGREY